MNSLNDLFATGVGSDKFIDGLMQYNISTRSKVIEAL